MQLALKGIPLEQHDTYTVEELQSAEYAKAVANFEARKPVYADSTLLADPVSSEQPIRSYVPRFLFEKLENLLANGYWQVLSEREHGIALELHTRLTKELTGHLFSKDSDEELPKVVGYHALADPRLQFKHSNANNTAVDAAFLASAVRSFKTNIRFVEDRLNTAYPSIDNLNPNLYVKMMGNQLAAYDPREGHENLRTAAISDSFPKDREYQTSYEHRIERKYQDPATVEQPFKDRAEYLCNKLVAHMNGNIVFMRELITDRAVSHYFDRKAEGVDRSPQNVFKVTSDTVVNVLSTVDIFGAFSHVNT